jgi:hypothetical protein
MTIWDAIADFLEEHGADPSWAALCRAPDNRSPVIDDPTLHLTRLPKIRSAIQSWIDDPAPKLEGIRIRVSIRDEESDSPYRRPTVELVMRGPFDDRKWEFRQVISGFEIEPGMVISREIIVRRLEMMHLSAIDLIRRERSES